MTKCTHDTLRDLCDALAANPVYSAAARRIGVSTKSIWRWLRASQVGDANLVFEWNDEVAPLHTHLRTAMRLNALMIEATARQHALEGFEEVQVFQGKICWKEDPKLAGLDDATLALLGYQDRYARNPDGSLIPLTVRRKPSDALVLKMLAAHFRRVYGDKVTVESSGILSVLQIGRDGKWQMPRRIEQREDQEEFVVSADAADVEPQQMRIGLVVGEPMTGAELEAAFGGVQPAPPEMIFEDEEDNP